MKPFYRKQLVTVALVWTVYFILFLFLYMFILAPQEEIRKSVENELDQKKQQYQSAVKLTEQETQVQLKNEVKVLQDKLKDFVVDFADAGNLTFDIGQIANKMGITAFSIQMKDKGGISEIPDCNYICESNIDINFSAQFSQFAMLLNALERHCPVIFVDGFMIIRSMQQTEPANRVNLNAVVFARKKQGG